MLLRPLPFCALTCVLVAFAAGCGSTPRPDVGAQLDALFDDLHAREHFDGAVVLRDERGVVWEGAYGLANVEKQIPFTTDTAADGGSMAKTFTAALLIMLENEGRLALDDPAQRYLPELPYPAITLRHLLSHSSGLSVGDYDYFDAELPPGEIRTTERLLGVIAARKPALAFRPGSAFEYSSFGFDLAALAASRAAGIPLEELLMERFFRPLGMNAFLRPARLADFPGTRTRGYRRDDGKLVPNDVFDYEAFHGGSNIYFSARGLHRWSLAHLNQAFLDETRRKTLERASIGGFRSGLTLGSWYDDGSGAFWYSGHLQGFHSEVFRDTKRGTSIVYISNNTIEPWLQKGIVRAVRAILAGKGHAPLESPATEELSPEDRLRTAGTWMFDHGAGVRITHDGERSRINWDGVTYAMIPIHPRFHYVPGIDWMVGFAREGEGPLTRIYVATNVGERWGRRAAE